MFQAYNANVRVVPVGSGSPAPVVLPVDTLTIRAVPYTPESGTVLTLFRGERKFVPPTFGFAVEMTWKNLGRDYPKIRAALDLWLNTPGANFVKNLQPAQTNDGVAATFDPGVIVPDIIPDLSEDALAVVFNERFRARPATLRFVSRLQNHTLPAWITS